VPREQAVREESHSFLERVFGGDASSLMAHFARRAELTPAEIAELRRLLDERAAGDEEPETGDGVEAGG
jgi:BlaI family penicillinase repressor